MTTHYVVFRRKQRFFMLFVRISFDKYKKVILLQSKLLPNVAVKLPASAVEI